MNRLLNFLVLRTKTTWIKGVDEEINNRNKLNTKLKMQKKL